MGDRTYVRIEIHPLDWHLVNGIFHAENQPNLQSILDGEANRQEGTFDEGVSLKIEGETKFVEVEIYEGNYGMYDEMEEASARGARFFGSHSYGSDYDCGACVGWAFTSHWVSLTRDGDAYARVAGGAVDEADLENIKRHDEAFKKFRASLEKLPPTWEEIIKLCPINPLNG